MKKILLIVLIALVTITLLLVLININHAVPNEEVAIEIARDFIKDTMYEEMSPYMEAEYIPERKAWRVSTPPMFFEEHIYRSIEIFIRRSDGNINEFIDKS